VLAKRRDVDLRPIRARVCLQQPHDLLNVLERILARRMGCAVAAECISFR
jgi:hypothetical protein